MIPTNNTIIQNKNINDLIALKPKQFRELPDALLIEIAPVLLAWYQEVSTYADSVKSTSYLRAFDDRCKAFDFSYLLRDRAEIAKRLPTQRREKAEKEARKNAREAKVKVERDTTLLIAPSVELILKHYESTIKKMIQDSVESHIKKHDRYVEAHKSIVAEVTSKNPTSAQHWIERLIERSMNNYVNDADKYKWEAQILKTEGTYDKKFIGYYSAQEQIEFYTKCATAFVTERFTWFAHKIAVRSIERHYRATKIAKDTLVNVDGGNQEIWEGSVITTHFKSGSYKFKTTLKYNRSKFNKIFIQFPTVEICGENENQNDLQDWA